MKSYNIAEAARNLSKIVAEVESGETVTLARRGVPVATLTPHEPEVKPLRRSPLEGKLGKAPDFTEPMSEEELALWEGR